MEKVKQLVMIKAVISTGAKQYLVSEGDEIDVELLNTTDKKVIFDALLVIDGNKTSVGNPLVSSIKVSADVIEIDSMAEKVLSIRYKSKKRVHKIRGHRQHHAKIKINKIA